MKKPIATSIEDVTPNRADSKRAERKTNARLTLARADREIQSYPGARSTPLIRDLHKALKDMIEELEYSKP